MSEKWAAFLVVSTGTILSTMDASGLNVALPALGRIFRASPETVLWVVLAHGLSYTGFTLIAGRMADLAGRKRVYTAGLLIFTLGLALCSTAQAFWQLVAYRVLQGVGGAMLVSNSNAIITGTFPNGERGKALGLLESVVGVGLMSGPVVAGVLLDVLDWRAIFYVRIPLALIGIVLAWSVLRETVRTGARPRFDVWGASLLLAGLICLMLAINQGPRAGWQSSWILGLTGAAVGSLALFLLVQARAREPVVDLALFRNRTFSAYTAGLLTFFIPLGAVLFLLPFDLMHGLGFTASRAGLFLTVVPLLMFILSPATGILSDWIGSRRVTTAGLTCTLGGLILLSRLGTSASAFQAVMGLGVLGVGAGLFLTPSYSAVLRATPPDRLGTASALIATLRNVGLSLGQASAATLFAMRQAAHEASLPSSLESLERTRVGLMLGFQDTMLVLAAVAAAGLIIVLAFGRR